MTDQNKYLQAIDAKINDFIINKNAQPPELYDPIKYILSIGGKRIRAVLTLLACELYNDSFESAIPAATGIEVFHNFTLLHDDIMDKASIRRGQPTVHEKWSENIAILSGDAMMVLANQLMTESDATTLKDVLQCFNQTAVEVCEGQQFDMNLEELQLSASETTTSSYLNMIKLKTSVLLAASLKIGACIGGASSHQQDLLYNAGLALGLGFQLQDDLLDSFGDEEKFGKRIGGDILVKKKTFLISKALELGSNDQKQALINLYNSPVSDETEHIALVQKLFVETGAKEQTEKLIDDFFKRAFELLNTVEINNQEALNNLTALFSKISNRKN